MRKPVKGVGTIKSIPELRKQVRKTDKVQLTLPVKESEPLTVTLLNSTAWQQGFDHFNKTQFDGVLPDVVIVHARRANSGGHFKPDSFTHRVGNGGLEHELSVNLDALTGRTDEFGCSVLLHEMTHLWQHVHGRKRRARYSYHDKEWSEKMISLGLMPSSTGMPGGRVTGIKMSHYIVEGGPFQKSFEQLVASGWRLDLQSAAHIGTAKKPLSKIKFECPNCQSLMWGKPSSQDICGTCNVWRKPEIVAGADAALNEAAE